MAAARKRIYLAGPLGFSEFGRLGLAMLAGIVRECGHEPVDPFALTPQAEIDRILDGKFPARVEMPTGPMLLGMTPAAKLLGVSRATLWRIIKAGRLSKVEVLPGSFRIRRADLEALAAGKVVV